MILSLLLYSCAGVDVTARGGQVLQSSDEAVWSVNQDDGSVSRLDTFTGIAHAIPVDGVPHRLAVVGERVYVAVSGPGRIVTLRASDGKVLDSTPVGAEPVDLVVAGGTVYVALASEHRVVALDRGSLHEQRSWAVDGEPRALVLHPSDQALFVTTRQGTLTRIDTKGDGAGVAVTIPELQMTDGQEDQPAGFRFTGDIEVSPDGAMLVAAGMYVDNVAFAGEESSYATTDTDGTNGGFDTGGAMTEAVSISRFEPALMAWTLSTRDGTLVTPKPAITYAVVASMPGAEGARRTALTGLAFSPDGSSVGAIMEGSAVALVVPAGWLVVGGQLDGASRFIRKPAADVAYTRAAVDGLPRGLAWDGDDLLVYEGLEREVVRWSGAAASDGATVERVATMERSAWPAEVELGRQLFNSAVTGITSAEGSGVACGSCHVDGRNDNLTWPLDPGRRQTPSLAGGIGVTAPFTWEGEVASVADEAFLTASQRMGGSELTSAQSSAIQAYVETIPLPDRPWVEPGAVARGSELFGSLGCADCHPAPTYTVPETVAVGGEWVNPPTLRGVSLSAPYYRSGKYATLRDVIENLSDGVMGPAFDLTDAQEADLEAFLRSL